MSNGSAIFGVVLLGGMLLWWGLGLLGLYLTVRQARRAQSAKWTAWEAESQQPPHA